MGLNKRRVLIVAGITLLMSVGAVGLYAVRFRHRQQASTLEASARQFVETGDFESAKIEVEKLLALKPQYASGHLLKGQVLLAGRNPSQLRTETSEEFAPIRSLIQAIRLDPELVDARKLLVEYFLAAGDANEAANHARVVLRHEPDDPNARFALASSFLEQRQTQEASVHAEHLLTHENPVRPRSAWLAARLGDLQGWESDLRKNAVALLDKFATGEHKWTAVDDQLALVELRAWQARRSDDAEQVRTQTEAAMAELKQMADSLEAGKNNVPPRLIVKAAGRLLPDPGQRSSRLAAVYQELEPKVAELTEHIYSKAIDAKSSDPSLYVSYASLLRDQGKVDEAIKVAESGTQIAKDKGSEFRVAFTLCDLWLAEHYLSNRQGDKAKPHLEALIHTKHLKSWGQLLTGYRLVQTGDFDAAFKPLEEAVVALPENGTANALFGLCQLRRGFVTEGRSHLEKGIRLGADEPQYKAWLAMALAEAGYQEQAVSIAQQVLSQPATKGLGRALLGQLRLRAGDYDQAAEDFSTALESADESFRPSLKLSQAELAIVRDDWETAKTLLDDLKKTPLAPQAYAVHYRYLNRSGNKEEADKLLEESRQAHADSMLLLAIHVSNLVQKQQHDEAVELLKAEQDKHPESPSPQLLLSEVYELQEEEEKSLEVLQQACKQFPDEAPLKIRLAERLLSSKKFSEATQVLADLKGNEKVNPATLDYLLARSASLQGDFAKAEEIIKKASEKDPDNPTLKFLLGKVAVKQGDYQAASQLFEQSLAGGAFREQTIHALFEALLRTGETDRAIELLGRAQRQGYTVRKLRTKLLQLLARREKWDVLERELDELIRNNPADSDFALGISLLRFMNQHDKAAQLVTVGLEKFPESMSLLEHKISLLIEKKEHEQAEELLVKLRQEHPENPTLHILYIALLLESKRLDDAAKVAAEGWEHCGGDRGLAALRVQVLILQEMDQQALEFAQQAKRDYPDLPSPRYLMARMYEAIGQDEKALNYLASTVASEPTNAQAAENYLRMLMNQGPPADFVEIVERLVTANPENPVLLGVLAEYHVSQGQLNEAEQVIQRIDSLRQAGPLLSYLKALVAFSRQNIEEAERSLTVALADPRGHIPSTYLLARTRVSQRRFQEALELLNQVCRQQPGLLSARQLQVQLLVQLGNVDEAEQSCRAYLKEHPMSRPAQQMLAEVLLKQGTDAAKAEALELAKNGLAAGVDSPSQFGAYLNVLLECGEQQAALKAMDAAQQRGQAEVAIAGARALLNAGHVDKAHDVAQSLYRRAPENVDCVLLLADATSQKAKETGDVNGFQQAAQHYREVLRLHKGHILAANNLAWTLGMHLRNPHRGLEEMGRVLPESKSPNSGLPAEVLDTIGTLHLNMGHLDEAQRFLEVATAKKPESAAMHFHLGLVYQEQNRTTRAEQCFAQAKRLDPNGSWDIPSKQVQQTD